MTTLPNYAEFGDQGLEFTLSIPYYFDKGIPDTPKKEEVEEQIRLGLLDNVDSCLDLSIFYDYSFKIDREKINFEVSVAEDRVFTLANIPIHLENNKKIISLDLFQIAIDSSFEKLLLLSEEITSKQKENGNSICLTCLTEMIDENRIQIDTYEIELEDYYVVFYFLKDNDKNEVYYFAHKFDLFENEIEEIIQEIDNLVVIIGYEFNYLVNAYGENLIFSDDSYLFDINPNTGAISFTPELKDSGNHIVTISVEDKDGNIDEEIFTLEVKHFGLKPEIPFIGYLDANVGESFVYPVNATSKDNLRLFYTDNSDFFDIGLENGTISFMPLESQIGVHSFNITVTDTNGNIDIGEGHIFVEE